MPTAVFAERGRVKLVSDSRDVGLPSIIRMEVYAWLGANGVTAEITHNGLGMDLWRIHDESQRALFVLRWM